MDIITEYIFDKEITFSAIKGTVHNITRTNRTEISGGGATGLIYNGSGTISADSVKTENYTDIEFWVHTDTGKKIPLQIPRSNLIVAENQNVSLIYASRPSESNMPALLTGFINYDADMYWPYQIEELMKMSGKYRASYWLIGFLGFIVVGYVANFIGPIIGLKGDSVFGLMVSSLGAYGFVGRYLPVFASNKVALKMVEILKNSMNPPILGKVGVCNLGLNVSNDFKVTINS